MMPYDNNDNQGNSCKLKINKEIYIYIYIYFFFTFESSSHASFHVSNNATNDFSRRIDKVLVPLIF